MINSAKLRALLGADLRSLAALRISLGALLALDLGGRVPDVAVFYSDAGVLPRHVFFSLLDSPWKFSLHAVSGSWQAQTALLLLALGCALGLMLGWRTRVIGALSWLLLASLHTRNPLVLQGGDALLRLALFWGMFLPWGAKWSLDSRRHPRAPGPAMVTTAATAALLIQIALVYLMSALEKAGPEWRGDGSALYYALSTDYFATTFGHALLRFPGLLQPLTHAVFWFEALAPLLLFAPVRTAAIRSLLIPLFWLLQMGFGLSLELGLFPWVSSAVMLTYVPGRWWDALERRWDRRSGMAVSGSEAATGSPPHGLTRSVQWLVAGLAVYVLLWNLGNLPGSMIRFPERLRPFGYILRLDQSWRMFAPAPPRHDGWFVLVGRLRNGRLLDLLNGGPAGWEKPALASRRYPNVSWRIYLHKLRSPRYSALPHHLARYLCRDWNAAHGGPEALEYVSIVFMSEPTPPPGGTAAVTPTLLRREACAGE